MSVRAAAEILEALVGFDTTSRNSNLPLIAWFSSWSVIRSKMWCSSELLGVRLWKCGSIADGSAESPILSSWACAA